MCDQTVYAGSWHRSPIGLYIVSIKAASTKLSQGKIFKNCTACILSVSSLDRLLERWLTFGLYAKMDRTNDDDTLEDTKKWQDQKSLSDESLTRKLMMKRREIGQGELGASLIKYKLRPEKNIWRGGVYDLAKMRARSREKLF